MLQQEQDDETAQFVLLCKSIIHESATSVTSRFKISNLISNETALIAAQTIGLLSQRRTINFHEWKHLFELLQTVNISKPMDLILKQITLAIGTTMLKRSYFSMCQQNAENFHQSDADVVHSILISSVNDMSPSTSSILSVIQVIPELLGTISHRALAEGIQVASQPDEKVIMQRLHNAWFIQSSTIEEALLRISPQLDSLMTHNPLSSIFLSLYSNYITCAVNWIEYFNKVSHPDATDTNSIKLSTTSFGISTILNCWLNSNVITWISNAFEALFDGILSLNHLVDFDGISSAYEELLCNLSTMIISTPCSPNNDDGHQESMHLVSCTQFFRKTCFKMMTMMRKINSVLKLPDLKSNLLLQPEPSTIIWRYLHSEIMVNQGNRVDSSHGQFVWMLNLLKTFHRIMSSTQIQLIDRLVLMIKDSSASANTSKSFIIQLLTSSSSSNSMEDFFSVIDMLLMSSESLVQIMNITLHYPIIPDNRVKTSFKFSTNNSQMNLTLRRCVYETLETNMPTFISLAKFLYNCRKDVMELLRTFHIPVDHAYINLFFHRLEASLEGMLTTFINTGQMIEDVNVLSPDSFTLQDQEDFQSFRTFIRETLREFCEIIPNFNSWIINQTIQILNKYQQSLVQSFQIYSLQNDEGLEPKIAHGWSSCETWLHGISSICPQISKTLNPVREDVTSPNPVTFKSSTINDLMAISDLLSTLTLTHHQSVPMPTTPHPIRPTPFFTADVVTSCRPLCRLVVSIIADLLPPFHQSIHQLIDIIGRNLFSYLNFDDSRTISSFNSKILTQLTTDRDISDHDGNRIITVCLRTLFPDASNKILEWLLTLCQSDNKIQKHFYPVKPSSNQLYASRDFTFLIIESCWKLIVNSFYHPETVSTHRPLSAGSKLEENNVFFIPILSYCGYSNKLAFRLKQDHIGVVSALKLSESGIYPNQSNLVQNDDLMIEKTTSDDMDHSSRTLSFLQELIRSEQQSGVHETLDPALEAYRYLILYVVSPTLNRRDPSLQDKMLTKLHLRTIVEEKSFHLLFYTVALILTRSLYKKPNLSPSLPRIQHVGLDVDGLYTQCRDRVILFRSMFRLACPLFISLLLSIMSKASNSSNINRQAVWQQVIADYFVTGRIIQLFVMEQMEVNRGQSPYQQEELSNHFSSKLQVFFETDQKCLESYLGISSMIVESCGFSDIITMCIGVISIQCQAVFDDPPSSMDSNHAKPGFESVVERYSKVVSFMEIVLPTVKYTIDSMLQLLLEQNSVFRRTEYLYVHKHEWIRVVGLLEEMAKVITFKYDRPLNHSSSGQVVSTRVVTILLEIYTIFHNLIEGVMDGMQCLRSQLERSPDGMTIQMMPSMLSLAAAITTGFTHVTKSMCSWNHGAINFNPLFQSMFQQVSHKGVDLVNMEGTWRMYSTLHANRLTTPITVESEVPPRMLKSGLISKQRVDKKVSKAHSQSMDHAFLVQLLEFWNICISNSSLAVAPQSTLVTFDVEILGWEALEAIIHCISSTLTDFFSSNVAQVDGQVLDNYAKLSGASIRRMLLLLYTILGPVIDGNRTHHCYQFTKTPVDVICLEIPQGEMKLINYYIQRGVCDAVLKTLFLCLMGDPITVNSSEGIYEMNDRKKSIGNAKLPGELRDYVISTIQKVYCVFGTQLCSHVVNKVLRANESPSAMTNKTGKKVPKNEKVGVVAQLQLFALSGEWKRFRNLIKTAVIFGSTE